MNTSDAIPNFGLLVARVIAIRIANNPDHAAAKADYDQHVSAMTPEEKKYFDQLIVWAVMKREDRGS